MVINKLGECVMNRQERVEIDEYIRACYELKRQVYRSKDEKIACMKLAVLEDIVHDVEEKVNHYVH